MTLLPGEPVSFAVAGKPVPWRVRVVRRGPRAGLKVEAASDQYQTRVGRAAWAEFRRLGLEQLDGALDVEVTLVFSRVQRLKHHPGRCAHTVAPDVDKVLRNVLDGLHLRTPAGRRLAKSGVLLDDARVFRSSVTAWYAAEGEEPHTHVTLRRYPCETQF